MVARAGDREASGAWTDGSSSLGGKLMHKKTVSGLAAAVAVTTALGIALAAPASAKGGTSHRTGTCSDGSTWAEWAKAVPGGDPGIQVKIRITSDEGSQTWD